jgi:hypothetical protein
MTIPELWCSMGHRERRNTKRAQAQAQFPEFRFMSSRKRPRTGKLDPPTLELPFRSAGSRKLDRRNEVHYRRDRANSEPCC